MSGEEEREQLFVAHQPVKSAMFASSHTHHFTLRRIHIHTYICFVADLPPPDRECCGLLQHCYYGIVSGCDENRHKQWCEQNENKCMCAKKEKKEKKEGNKHKGMW